MRMILESNPEFFFSREISMSHTSELHGGYGDVDVAGPELESEPGQNVFA